MARAFDQHLDASEIDALVVQGVPIPGGAKELAGQTPGEAALHAEKCQECKQKVRMHRNMQDVLKGLRTEARSEPSSNCPERTDWGAVLSGQLPEAIAMSLLQHAAHCPYCGGVLKELAETLSNEVSDEEEAQLLIMPGSSLPWQADLAEKLHSASKPAEAVNAPPQPGPIASPIASPVASRVPNPDPSPGRRRWSFFKRPMFLYTAATMALLIAAVWLSIPVLRPKPPTALIAEAYSEHRTLELRLRGAKSAPVRVVRGETASNLDKPVPLLQAEEQIARKLKENGSDPYWLQLSAQADMLDGHYESALKSLDRARESQPKSIGILTDTATAYFMQAEATGRAKDYAEAINLLGQVLAIAPNDSVALYNRAKAEERIFLYHEALADWEKFLTIEADSAWRAEGRQSYDALQKTLQQRDQSSVAPIRDAAAALSPLLLRASTTGEQHWPATLDESYVDVALTRWLSSLSSPRMAGVATQKEDDAARRSLVALGQVLLKKHSDHWLSDLMAGSESRAWKNGAYELSVAVAANAAGDVSSVLRHGALARHDFLLSRNRAGHAIATFQYLSGLNRSGLGDLCMPVALAGEQEVRNQAYPWVEANLMLESSTCAGSRGDPEKAAALAQRAEAIADATAYENVRLETLYYLDGVTAPWVASNESWDRIRAGLSEFWGSSSPASYGANFYADMVLNAEAHSMWHLAEEAGKESVWFHVKAGDRTAEAAAHHYLAQVAEAADDEQLADAQYEQAAQLLQSSRQGDPTASIMLEIDRASLEVRQKKMGAAALRLANVAKGLCGLHSEYADLPYYQALGELHLRTDQPRLAEAELRRAVDLIEGNTSSLASDPDRLLWHKENARPYRDLLELYTRTTRDEARSFAFQEWYRAAPLRVNSRNRRQHAEGSRNACSSETGSPAKARDTPILLAAFSPEHFRPPPDTALVSWLSFPTGLAVWLLDSQGVTLHWNNVPADTLHATITRFARLCADPGSDRALLDRDARQLYAWMVQPFLPHLAAVKTLIVESDEMLGPIPFQVLRSPDGRYVNEQFAIVESPGVAYGRRLRTADAVSADAAVLSVGNPLLDPDSTNALPPLPDAETEANNVSKSFDRHYLLTGPSATLAEVDRLLPSVQVLHFAGHSLPKGPQPGLLLAGGTKEKTAILDAGQLQSRDLRRLRLVVLSGCDTAVAENGLVDPASLVRIFLHAGVPHVVASKWQVDSHTTSELMTEMYSSLLLGKPVSSALRSAEETIRLRPETSHPYYWAAFAHFGA